MWEGAVPLQGHWWQKENGSLGMRCVYSLVCIHPCESSFYLLTCKGYPHTVYLFPKLCRAWAGWSTCPYLQSKPLHNNSVIITVIVTKSFIATGMVYHMWHVCRCVWAQVPPFLKESKRSFCPRSLLPVDFSLPWHSEHRVQSSVETVFFYLCTRHS